MAHTPEPSAAQQHTTLLALRARLKRDLNAGAPGASQDAVDEVTQLLEELDLSVATSVGRALDTLEQQKAFLAKLGIATEGIVSKTKAKAAYARVYVNIYDFVDFVTGKGPLPKNFESLKALRKYSKAGKIFPRKKAKNEGMRILLHVFGHF